MINRSSQPPVNNIESIVFPNPDIIKLSNGIPVYIINSGTQDIIKIEFIFDAGSWYQPAPLTARYACKMLSEGTRNYSSLKISEEADFRGAYISCNAGRDYAGITLLSLTKHLPELFPIIHEMIVLPEYPTDRLGIFLQKDKQSFRDDMMKVNEVAAMHFSNMLFGGQHPYGYMLKESDFGDVASENLKKFHALHYHADSCRIIISGPVSDNTLKEVEKFFCTIPSVNPDVSTKPIPAATKQTRSKTVKMHGTSQSAIRIGSLSPGKSHPDYFGLYILNTILGGYFGSRLMKNIREDKGLTYGIYSSLASFRHASLFFISSELKSSSREEALKEIYHELEILKNEPVPQEELKLVIAYMKGSLLRSFDGPFNICERLKGILDTGSTLSHFYGQLFDSLNNISAEDLIAIANKYLDKKQFTEIIAG